MQKECLCQNCINYRAQSYPANHPEKCVIEFAKKPSTLDKVWDAICDGMVKESEELWKQK